MQDRNYTEMLEKKDRIIRYLMIEILKLGGGERCPRCNEWTDVEQTEADCFFCGGLGFYIPNVKKDE